jgi:hypothetical protein
MYLPSKGNNGINVSPYTEWRWSPMGLAGRDPIFFAQLESELAYVDEVRDAKTREALAHTVIDTCFRCHGVMGKRQHDLDHPGGHFALADLQRTVSAPGAKYCALARDGVSCTACHHVAQDTPPPGWTKSPLEYFLTHAITGLFETGPPDKVFGPFKDEEIVTVPMNNALGAKPAHNDYVKSADVRGLPHDRSAGHRQAADQAGRSGDRALDGAGDLPQWLNSQYQNEFGPPKEGEACQDCHMPGGYTSAPRARPHGIQTRFDRRGRDVSGRRPRAPAAEIRVRFRDQGFVRHGCSA